MKAVIIARVSTEEQREAGNSLPLPPTPPRLRRAGRLRVLNAIARTRTLRLCIRIALMPYFVRTTKGILRLQHSIYFYINHLKRMACHTKLYKSVVWRGLVDAFRNGILAFGMSLQRIQTTFSTFGIPLIQC